MKALITVLLLSTLLSGCVVAIGGSGSGESKAAKDKDFSFDDANRVRNGMTRQQVAGIMRSQPTRIMNAGNAYVWLSGNSAAQISDSSRVVVFNFEAGSGKVTGLPENGVCAGDTATLRY